MVKDLNQLAVVRIFADQTAVKLLEGSLISRVLLCVMKTLPLLWCCCGVGGVGVVGVSPWRPTCLPRHWPRPRPRSNND